MARIRTIKPEFPQSESMGRVSRAARLCFMLLWTLADDSGRLRGSSRMLASLLYPYDDDAPKLMDAWLAELDLEGCTRRYKIGSDTYVEICNWLKHQKIDRASKSKIPEFTESSRILANALESSSGDQGSRIKDQGVDQGSRKGPPSARNTAPIEFEDLKKTYPKRAGDPGWARALRACNARLSEGHAWVVMLSGAARYHRYCTVTEKIGTEFVKQASTFFGPEKHFLLEWAPPLNKTEVRRDANVDASLNWLSQQEQNDADR